MVVTIFGTDKLSSLEIFDFSIHSYMIAFNPFIDGYFYSCIEPTYLSSSIHVFRFFIRKTRFKYVLLTDIQFVSLSHEILKQSVSSVETTCFTYETSCFFTWYYVEHRFVRLPLTRIMWTFRTVFKGCIAVVLHVGSIHDVNTYISLSNARNVEMYRCFRNSGWEIVFNQSLDSVCLHFFTSFGSRS